MAALASAVLTAALVACSGGTPESTPKTTDGPFGDLTSVVATESATVPTAPDGTINLRQAGCPDPIVILTDGPASLNQSALFGLLGGTRPAAADHYVDDLIDPTTTKTTGVQLEVRFGARTSNLATLTTDHKVFAALAATDDQMLAAARTPSVAVVAPWQHLDRIIYWDPATFPLTQAIPDLGIQNVPVRVADQGPWLGDLIGTGLLAQKQIVAAGPTEDLSAAFVADGGRVASEGSALIEPVTLGRSSRWGRALGFQLVANAGYDPYPAAIVVRPGDVVAQRSCLRAFVPLIQAAQAHFAANPDTVARVIARVARETGSPAAPSQTILAARSTRAVGLGLIANGPDGVIGSIDAAKIRQMLAALTPVARRRRTPIPPTVKAEDLFTDEFLSRLIALPD